MELVLIQPIFTPIYKINVHNNIQIAQYCSEYIK